jgi:two-component system chemotaxis response regulator CheB
MPARDIVVIGGSSGALEALRTIVTGLTPDFPAAVFVALHTSPEGPGLLPQIITRASRLDARFPRDGERFTHGRVYVAPPDRHLILKRDYVRVTRGPRENRFRPAVDPLFRTAAVAHRNRVIAVILSGGHDDGAVGVGMIKSFGGIAIVQDPAEANTPGMPEAAIRHAAVDHIVPSGGIAALLQVLTQESVEPMEVEMSEEVPQDVAEVGGHMIHHSRDLGAPSPFTCPDCGGTLWQSRDGDIFQFQCHIGHRYSGDSLVSAQDDALDQALWSGLRALEESSELRRRMARHARARGMDVIARNYDDQAAESELRATVIRRVLMPERNGKEEAKTATPVASPSGTRS